MCKLWINFIHILSPICNPVSVCDCLCKIGDRVLYSGFKSRVNKMVQLGKYKSLRHLKMMNETELCSRPKKRTWSRRAFLASSQFLGRPVILMMSLVPGSEVSSPLTGMSAPSVVSLSGNLIWTSNSAVMSLTLAPRAPITVLWCFCEMTHSIVIYKRI